MKIGKYKNLVNLSKTEPQNKELAGKLRDGSVTALRRAQVTLLDPNSSTETKQEVVDDLRDIRSAFTNVHGRIKDEVRTNARQIVDNNPSYREIGDRSEGKAVSNISLGYSSSRVNSEGNNPWISDRGGRKWLETEGAQPTTGINNFIVGLNRSIGLASAVAALPPGPVAVSVSTLPKVDADSNFSITSASDSQSKSGSDSLLGLAYASAERSNSSSRTNAQGESRLTRSSIDERLNTGLEELAFQAEQLESRPPVDITVVTSYEQKTLETDEIPYFFGLKSYTVERWESEFKNGELEPQRLQSEHIWMPESSDSRFE